MKCGYEYFVVKCFAIIVLNMFVCVEWSFQADSIKII